MRKQILSFALSFLVVALGAFIANAQGRAQYVGEGDYNTTSLWVTATAGKDHIRFASLGIGQRMRLEVLNQAGDRVFDSDFHDGSLLDWQMDDSQGNRLPDDVYGCLVTVEDMMGQSNHRRGVFRVTDGVARFEISRANSLDMTASSEEQDTVTILRDDAELPIIQLLHDGQSGRIVSGKGDLSFRVGNALAGKDVEYMHLTANGNLGIGVSEPLAKLDVAGIIRAQGIMFSDGTIQKTAAGAGAVVVSELERRLAADGTLVVAGSGGSTASNPSGAADGPKQMLARSKPIDPVAAYEGPNNTFYGTGAGATIGEGSYNSFFGAEAGLNETNGSGNTFIGTSAGYNNSGSYTCVMPDPFFGCLLTLYTGSWNSFVGYAAGTSNSNGNYNSFFGNQAGYSNTSGSSNSFFGLYTGISNTTGNYNAFFGSSAGSSNTTEHNNSFIGAYSDGAVGITNATAIGYLAKVTQSNSLVLGSINGVNTATADTKVGIGTTTPDRKLQIASSPGMNAELHIGGAGDEAKDVFSGMGVDLSAGPAFNFGYSGFSFGRSSGFFNVRPDPSAIAPNPSLRFMTANQQRMIITNTGNVGIGTSAPKTTFQADGGDMYVGSPGQGMILRSPDGLVCVRLTVSNTAALVSTPLACP